MSQVSNHLSYDHQLKRFNAQEFPVFLDQATCWYPKNGVFHLAYLGESILELHPDNSVYLIIPKRMTSGVTGRWEDVAVLYATFTCNRVKRTNGLTEYEVTLRKKQHPYTEVSSIRARQRIRLHPGGKLENADLTEQVATKDNEKYRAFTAKLKTLKAALVAQVKMGAYDFVELAWWSNDNPFFKEWNAMFPSVPVRQYQDCRKALKEHVHRYLAEPSALDLKPLAFLCFRTFNSEQDDKQKDKLRRIINALQWVQGEYLREECVTISDSNKTLRSLNDDDSISELLPPAGLREVQVPSEAQVC